MNKILFIIASIFSTIVLAFFAIITMSLDRHSLFVNALTQNPLWCVIYAVLAFFIVAGAVIVGVVMGNDYQKKL